MVTWLHGLGSTRSTVLSSRSVVRGLFLLASLIILPAPAAAQSVPKEYQLRAVMLWRFAQFTEWPASAFESPESPLIIGVLGENPFGDAVRVAVKGETAHGRRIEVKYFRRFQNAVTGCHVLYISHSESGRLTDILAAIDRKPILTVSDIEGFAREGRGIVRFLPEQSRVAIRINVEAARAAHLVLDSRLLRLAEVVPSQ
ncbi:MAG: hypothetical protein C5B50_18400 [Verrucomicrobia bacterium]|nr:MAG: hypothetical protein C5B50_18400 [Verrucomicrobiota bacterium]